MTKFVCKYTDFVLFDSSVNKNSIINDSVYTITSTKCDGNEPGTISYQLALQFDYFNHAFPTIPDMANYFTYYVHKLWVALNATNLTAATTFKANMAQFQQLMTEKFPRLRFFVNDTWDVNGLIIMVEEHANGTGTFYYIKEGIKTTN